MRRCNLTANSAAVDGGGVSAYSVYGSQVIVEQVIFDSNSAGHLGSALWATTLDQSIISFLDSTLLNGQVAMFSGPGLVLQDGQIKFINGSYTLYENATLEVPSTSPVVVQDTFVPAGTLVVKVETLPATSSDGTMVALVNYTPVNGEFGQVTLQDSNGERCEPAKTAYTASSLQITLACKVPGLSGGAIAGIVVGCVVALALAAVAIVFFVKPVNRFFLPHQHKRVEMDHLQAERPNTVAWTSAQPTV